MEIASCQVCAVEIDDLRRLVNHQRLHGEITADASYINPAEHEARYYDHTMTTGTVVIQ